MNQTIGSNSIPTFSIQSSVENDPIKITGNDRMLKIKIIINFNLFDFGSVNL